MATYYVYSGATGGATGADWTNAVTTLAAGLALATTAGDTVRVASDHVEVLAVDTTFTWPASVYVISTNRGTDAAEKMSVGGGYVGHTTSNRSMSFDSAAGIRVYQWGMYYQFGGSTADSFIFSPTDGGGQVHEECSFIINNTNSTSTRFLVGQSDKSANVRFKNCDIKLSHAGQYLGVGSVMVMEGGSINGSVTLSALIKPNGVDQTGCRAYLSGVDLTPVTGISYLVGDCLYSALYARFDNCKMPTSWSALASQTNGLAGGQVEVFNCANGDEHYHFGHYNSSGETVAVTSPYANDGALYDGTNHVTWQITTSSTVSEFTPYISPWIERYHAGTSAITPSLEILRNGSATAFKDNEVWGEWSYQGTSGNAKASFAGERAAILGTPANQEAGVGLTGWTGESGTAWSGKLTCPSITPAEIGPLRARVCVGLASTTVFVDPTIRGAV